MVVKRLGRAVVRGLIALAGLAQAGMAGAICSVANQYNFSFSSAANIAMNYATTYTYTGTSTALGNQNFRVNFIRNNLASATAGGVAMPHRHTLITDGTTPRNLVIGGRFGARSNAAFTTNYIETVFTFTVPIRDFTVRVNDMDFTNNQFRDWIQLTGSNGVPTYTPSLFTPFGTSNATGAPKTNPSSSQVVGVAAAPVAVTVSQAAGTGASPNNATTGTITASFAQPVTIVRLRWGNYPLQPGETTTGQQAIGIQSVSWCPMPQLTFVKSSTPVITAAGDPGRFNAPGNDVYYNFTISNSNTSPIDAGLVLIDGVPTQMTFFNGDIDGTGPLTSNFEFIPGSSGLTFADANLTYSNNGGSTFVYNPAAGYDAAVNAVRLAPQGTMAANSSFSLRLRTRIK